MRWRRLVWFCVGSRIAGHGRGFEEGKEVCFAITEKRERQLIGCIGFNIDRENEKAELGYWIGKEYWGKGYCSEAGRAVVDYCFDELDLNRAEAHYFKRNSASGRVMEKIGMLYEGCVRDGIKKWGRFDDLVLYGMVKSDHIIRNGDVGQVKRV